MAEIVLGIDLGSNSIGVALIDKSARTILFTGARTFAAGMKGNDKEFHEGKEVSPAVDRRESRLARRQTRRRAQRQRNVFRLLQSFGMLPEGEAETVIKELDKTLYKRFPQTQLLPYFLRARSLDHCLQAEEFGRVLYHLSQRRGFLSNRKVAPKKDEDPGKVKASIEGLWKQIADAGKRTLGEYFASLDPHTARIRTRYTHRKMYEAEFDAIWSAQAASHPEALTEQRRASLFHALFFQRPLRDQSDLVGECDLVEGEKRAPLRLLEYQRYRYLTVINNLRLFDPKGNPVEVTREDRLKIAKLCEYHSSVTWASIKKALGVNNLYRFKNQDGGETKIPGNITYAKLAEILNLRWDQMPEEERNDLVEDVGDGKRCPTDDDVEACALQKWGCTPEEAKQLAELSLPAGYGSISLTAIRIVMPELVAGATFAEARHRHFPQRPTEVVDVLPPVKQALKEIRNPGVIRALTELRKTVNAIVRKYGKPDAIHVELARELRKPAGERQKASKRNRENEKERNKAREALLPYCGDAPSRRDIEKYILYQECAHQCPYTGQAISLDSLYGMNPRFDIEHMIPFSFSLDDSLANKTLCDRDTNLAKGNRTPWQAFGHTPEWEQMEERVRALKNPGKLRRFVLKEENADELLREFSERQLNDTKYASRLAARYLGRFYGGVDDADGRKRVFTCAGQITAQLRRIWDMNTILSESLAKSRDDHRHHAVDAAAIAFATPAVVKQMSDAAARATQERKRQFGSMAPPWVGFKEDLAKMIAQTVVSLRPVRKLQGALHKETIYGTPYEREGRTWVHIRRKVEELKAADIDFIVDSTVRHRVALQLAAVGGDPKKFAADPPTMPETRDGRVVPIRKVRVREAVSPIIVGKSRTARAVVPDGNHHMEVIACLGDDGKIKRYSGIVVSVFEAMQRKMRAEPIIQKDHGPMARFLFTLSEGDTVEMRHDRDSLVIYRVRGVTGESNGRLDLCQISDARLKADIIKSGSRLRPPVNGLMNSGGRKVTISHLGEVLAAND